MIERLSNDLGEWINDYAKGELNLIVKRRRKTSTGALRDSLTYRPVLRGADLRLVFASNEVHAKPVHYGRRKGVFPPVAPIMQWIDDKPIRLRDKDGQFIKKTEKAKKQVAYLIARKIAKDGIEPFPYYTRAIEKSLERRRDLYQKIAKEQVRIIWQFQ